MFSKSVRRLGQQDGGQSVSAVRAGFREAEGTGGTSPMRPIS
jgi:hypothetical protein